MRKIAIICLIGILMLTASACVMDATPDYSDYLVSLPSPVSEPVRTPLSPQTTNGFLQQLFPNGISTKFRDAYNGAESDEMMSNEWNIYYADVEMEEYWNYVLSLLSNGAYIFDMINSDRLVSDLLIKNAAYASFPESGQLCAAMDDPDYAYVRVCYYNRPVINSNGFRYTMRINITPYDVDPDYDGLPDNTVKGGSILGMDQEKAEEAYFTSDSPDYLITEEEVETYNGFEMITKYSFNSMGNLISKRIKLGFSDQAGLLQWYYDADENGEAFYNYESIVIVGRTIYASERLSEQYDQISEGVYDVTKSEIKALLDRVGLKYYLSK